MTGESVSLEGMEAVWIILIVVAWIVLSRYGGG